MRKRILALTMALCLFLAACSAGTATPSPEPTPTPAATPTPTPTPAPEPTPYNGPVNPLTGLPIEEKWVNARPIAVMLNNVKEAQPQLGQSQADIIYEVLVEGGITRMLGGGGLNHRLGSVFPSLLSGIGSGPRCGLPPCGRQ